MTEVIGIKFEETGAVEYVVPDKNYAKDDFVVVLEKKDKRLAQVVMENADFPEVSLPADLNRVEGLAGEKDFARYDENLLKAEKSMGVVADLIAQNQLEMKVVDIVFPLNCSYVLISFVAEKRVDFRQLLKDLASYFKTRIELRQISSREESKIYGGLGPCGRALCCSSFLGEFPPVSIKMAKNQSLSLNSGKMNGVCGRLMCCLSYEDDFYRDSKASYPDLGDDFYRDSKASYPDLGDDIETKDGTGQVVAIDVIAGTIKVVFEKGRAPLTYGVEEVQLNGKA
ncbi:regulatory iron-sulfur-containing complex subunit RicT [Streptococcus sp. 27098_8_74]|uniref:regulatory iron-sulfur-containing complex subunit RicT n=1 Tax=Streptococcus sp. 27098_8_74 TaxID=3003646 RepID=UPI00352CCF51